VSAAIPPTWLWWQETAARTAGQEAAVSSRVLTAQSGQTTPSRRSPSTSIVARPKTAS
jgi:hypothetical protein